MGGVHRQGGMTCAEPSAVTGWIERSNVGVNLRRVGYPPKTSVDGTAMMKPNTNLFTTMGKYVLGQQENLLTQSLAGIFNNSPAFRRDFGRLLSSRRTGGSAVDLKDTYARTQKPSDLRHARIIVDAEICESPDSGPCYVIEAKLEQALGKKQLDNYAKYLKTRARNATLVLLTKYGIDPELSPSMPKGTIWLTWMEVREVCRRLQGASAKLQASNVDRFLAKEFADMLDQNDVPSVDPISAGRWKKLRLFNKHAAATGDSDVNWDTLETVTTAIARMRVFADAAWEVLTAEGYKPHARTYTWFPKETDDWEAYATVEVGYGRPARGSVYYRYIELSLDCCDLELLVVAGWGLRKDHREHGRDYWFDHMKEWPAKASRELFRRPLRESLDKIRPDLDAALKKFKKTKYYRAK